MQPDAPTSPSSAPSLQFLRAGGGDQVIIRTGADIAHLAELDQKLWVALACPTRGVEFDPRTLDLIDTDGDGRIRPPELLAACAWACERLRDPDELARPGPVLDLSALDGSTEDGDFVRRRRQCGACDKRFTTYERPEVSFPNVVKKDGRRIEYDRSKLIGSFSIALRKRPVSTTQIDSAIERIEEKLLNLGQREVISSRIGELVMRELKKLDKVAYIRFASVYRSFEDIDEFKTLVDEVRR